VSNCAVLNFTVVPGYVEDKRAAEQTPAILTLPQAYTKAVPEGSAAITVTATVASSQTASSATCLTAPKRHSKEKEIGLGVGLPLLLALLAALFLIYRSDRKLKALRNQHKSVDNSPSNYGTQATGRWSMDPVHEAPKSNVVYEAPGNQLAR
jgi:hypothetical protein